MVCVKLAVLLATVFLVCVNSAYLKRGNEYEDLGFANILQDDADDFLSEVPHESVHPGYLRHARPRRQAMSTSLGTSGVLNSNVKVPLAGNDKNILSGIGSAGLDLKTNKLSSIGGGLALDNVNGHGASLTGRHIPGFGDQLTGAGHVNLLHNENHRLDANAFATRNMPSIPNVPNFNTYGGGMDYMYKDKIGGSLGVAKTPFLDKTDYSAMGNLNLFRSQDRSSSLDFSAGLSKSVAPFIRNPSWEPSAGLTFSKRW